MEQEQPNNEIVHKVIDANKENRNLSNVVGKRKVPSGFVQQTLRTAQPKQSKVTPTKRVLLDRRETSADPPKKVLIDSTNTLTPITEKSKMSTSSAKLCSANRKSTVLKLKRTRTSAPRTSMPRDSLTLNVNPLNKAVVHRTKAKRRKSMQSKSSLQKQVERSDPTGSSTAVFAKPANKLPCNLCDKSFFFKTTLAAHQKSHTALNSCQFCRRTFAVSAALFKHLREHCSKIPFAERRKLLAAEDETASAKKQPVSKFVNSTDELLDYASRFCAPAESCRLKLSMQRNTPIKGINRTPTKLIKCSCGDKFINAFEFATHAELCAVNNKKTTFFV